MDNYFSDKELHILCRLIDARHIETQLKLDAGPSTDTKLMELERKIEAFKNLKCKVEELKNNSEKEVA